MDNIILAHIKHMENYKSFTEELELFGNSLKLRKDEKFPMMLEGEFIKICHDEIGNYADSAKLLSKILKDTTIIFYGCFDDDVVSINLYFNGELITLTLISNGVYDYEEVLPQLDRKLFKKYLPVKDIDELLDMIKLTESLTSKLSNDNYCEDEATLAFKTMDKMVDEFARILSVNQRERPLDYFLKYPDEFKDYFVYDEIDSLVFVKRK